MDLTLLLLVLGALIGVAGVAVVAGVAAWLFLHTANAEARRLVRRIGRLPFRRKLRLAVDMAKDDRIPLAVRLIPPALVLYLSMPLDIVPDFIPVLGQLDDAIVVAVGVGLLLRFAPRHVLEERVAWLESSRDASV